MRKILLIILIGTFNFPILAQNFDSNTGNSNATDSSNLPVLSPIDSYTASSSKLINAGRIIDFIDVKAPSVTCFETSTNAVTTSCTNIPGSDGMRGVCSEPGCYNRAKVEINTQNNSDDVKYAIQIATNPSFTTEVKFISGSNRFPKSTLAITDFLYKCEWEGTIYSSYCAGSNITYQKFNILGLRPGTLYYLRVAALTGVTSTTQYTLSNWSASVTATTQFSTLTFDIDIAQNESTSTTPPYKLSGINIIPDKTFTSSDYIFFKSTTNLLNGMFVGVNIPNAYLVNTLTGSTIPSISGDLDSLSAGFGLRNDSNTNSQINSENLGRITISNNPIDYTDTGAANRVGGPTTKTSTILNSNKLPLLNGVAGFKLKVKSDLSKPAGEYNQTISIIPTAID